MHTVESQHRQRLLKSAQQSLTSPPFIEVNYLQTELLAVLLYICVVNIHVGTFGFCFIDIL